MLTKGNVSAGATYQYPVQGAAAVRPHAVKSIPSVGDFIYDLNGNLESGAGRTTSWSSFDMPLKIVNGTSVSGFVYGPEHQRTYQCKAAGASCVNGSGIVYADRQEVEVKNGQTTVKTYWPDGLGLEIDKTDQSGQPVTELNWTHVDRLGSPVLITDANGNVREKLAYDTWGKRRNHDASLAGGSVTPNTLDGVTDNKGYTGHEMLDDLDLVHMNGRLYDPMIGKFMSGEPLVQDPINGQSYNRYSYVLNNPTNLTDPTGFRPELIDVTGSAIPAKTPEEAEARAQGLGTQVMVFREPSKPSSSQPTVNQAGTAQVDGKNASANNRGEKGLLTKISDFFSGGDRETNCGSLGCIHQGTGDASPVTHNTGDLIKDVVMDEYSKAASAVVNAGNQVAGWWKTATLVGLGAVGEGATLAKEGLTLWPAASGGRTTINGIEYTVHALERMQPVGTIIQNGVMESRGLPVSVIENAIKFGKVSPGNTSAEVVRTFENVRVVTNPAGTRVITVMKSSK